MTLAITINVILSLLVFVLIVGPILWAIRTHHRHELVVIARTRRGTHLPEPVPAACKRNRPNPRVWEGLGQVRSVSPRATSLCIGPPPRTA